jgi:hypothetical protein
MAGKPGEDRMSQREAATAGKSSSGGGSGGTGGGNKTEHYKDPERGLETSYGAPIHTSMDGPGQGTQFARDKENWSNLKDRVNQFNDARREYENRDLFDKLVDLFAGPIYNDNEPDFNDPDTFWGGHYHSSTNPAGVAGLVAGSALGLGLGTVGLGTVASQIGSQLGPEAYHNPASEETERGLNFTGQHGLDKIAADHADDGKERPSPTGSTRTGNLEGGLMTGAPPSLIATGATQQPTTTNPPVPPTGDNGPQTQIYPKPEELWGKPGQDGTYVFDAATKTVRFVAY